MDNIQFIIVDDHKMLSDGLKTFLLSKFPSSSVAGVFSGAEELNAFLDKNELPEEVPCVALVDLNIAGKYSFPLIKELSKRKVKVVVYTMYESSLFAMQAIESGALCYILKGSSEEDIVHGVEAAVNGTTFISKRLDEKIASVALKVSLFSPKEKILAGYLLQGLTNSEIAAAMKIVKRSVENYLSRMYEKTGVFSREDLKAFLRGGGAR